MKRSNFGSGLCSSPGFWHRYYLPIPFKSASNILRNTLIVDLAIGLPVALIGDLSTQSFITVEGPKLSFISTCYF
jgi:hypothetical protein